MAVSILNTIFAYQMYSEATIELDEEAFVKAFNRQEHNAYQTLYRLFYRALVAYALQQLNKQDEAEDIVQELFVSMWKKKTCFTSYTALRSYLYHSVNHAVVNCIKHQQVKERYAEAMQNDPSQLHFSSDYRKEEIYRQLYLAIDRLPDRCREIFLMHMDGKKNEEIAQILHISVETVKTQKKRAMRFLKNDPQIKNSYGQWILLLQLSCSLTS